jgi:hypothetical protein
VNTGNSAETVTLWRPAGPEEIALVEASGWREWPPRLPEQPIFYPVLNEEYATKIARDWNVRHSGSGYVTHFEVRRSFLDQYEVRQAGGRTILEYWIPAGDLPEFNANIVGLITVAAEYHRDPPASGTDNRGRRHDSYPAGPVSYSAGPVNGRPAGS